MGWSIVAHGLALVFRNIGAALRVSVGPLLIAAFLGWLAFRLTGASPQMILFGLAVGRLAPQAALAISLTFVVFLFASAWVSVAWHRFVLTEEYPGLIPTPHGSRIAAYCGRSILLAIVIVVILFPVSAIAGQIFIQTGLALIPGGDMLFGFLLGTMFMFLWLRIAIVLPATALGRTYSLSQGWSDGGRQWREVLRAAAIVTLLNMVVTGLLDFVPLGVWPGLIVQAVLAWASMMVGLSLLTTLYGHLVEGRSLN